MAEIDQKTVLIVDDDEINRRAYAEMLEINNLNVLEAVDGQDAIELYQKHADKIHLVVLDVIMPRLNGRDALRAIRKINPHCCCLMVTGYIDAEPLQDIVDQGVSGILRKPFGMSELLGWVNKIIAANMCRTLSEQ